MLEQVLLNPKLLDSMPRACLVKLYQEAARVEAELRARLLAQTQATGANVPATLEPPLNLGQAAALLATSKDTLYRKWQQLPFAYKDQLDGQIKFSRAGLESYMRKSGGS
jgi:hypothetical protein